MSSTRTQLETTWLVDGDPVTGITEMVSIASGKDVTELEPLARATDVDALVVLLSQPDVPVELTFSYEGFEIVVRSTGELTLTAINPRGHSAVDVGESAPESR